MKVPINQFLHQLRAQLKVDQATKVVFLSIGNPEPKYAGTRHNAGHRILTNLQARYSGLQRETTLASVVMGPLAASDNIIFAKSTEFMNLSARAAMAVLRSIHGNNVHMIIVHDDMSLEAGEVKFKLPSKAFGGHNGLRDLARIGEFARLRVGIGAPIAMDSKYVTKHVLGKFTVPQKDIMDTKATDQAQNTVDSILELFQPRMRAIL